MYVSICNVCMYVVCNVVYVYVCMYVCACVYERFYTFCKVGTGYSLPELAELHGKVGEWIVAHMYVVWMHACMYVCTNVLITHHSCVLV